MLEYGTTLTAYQRRGQMPVTGSVVAAVLARPYQFCVIFIAADYLCKRGCNLVRTSRISVVLMVLVGVVVVAVSAWTLGTKIQSPAEAAARTAPPEPSPILVPVEERVLTSNIVTRGTAHFERPQPVSVTPSIFKPEPGIITSLPETGHHLAEGDLLLTASGRPLFLLQGEIPVYRDLMPGLFGSDVGQFEAALKRLGFDPGPLDEVYDAQTSAAVEAWYQAAGWRPFGPTEAQQAQKQHLETALADAHTRQIRAKDQLALAPALLEVAQIKAELASRNASVAVTEKTAQRDAIAGNAGHTASALAQAETDLLEVQLAANIARLENDIAVQAARDSLALAEREAELAAAQVEKREQDLATFMKQFGVQIPADEIAFISQFPARVDSINVEIGAQASGVILQVANDRVVIDSSLPLDEASFVQPGMRVIIDEPDLGIHESGLVVRVASKPGTDGVDGFHIYFETRVDETETELAGFSLRLTIAVESTAGAVTAVPVSALSLTVDGTSRVTVAAGDQLTHIPVEPGLAAAGFVEVVPLRGDLVPGDLVVIGYE